VDWMRRQGDTDARRMLVAASALMVGAMAIQLVAFRHGGHGSLSDLPRVFLHRGVGPDSLPYLDRMIEYPVVAGLLLYLASLVSASPLGVLIVTGVAAAALFLMVTVLLARRFGRRAWRWAVATPVLLYAFQNWDMFAIAALVVGLLMFEQKRHSAAGVAFGLGAAVKLFPMVVVPPLVALRWAQGDRRGAKRLAATSAAVFAMLNLPVLLASPSGWWWPFAFQSRRQATWGTNWFLLFRVLGLPVHGAVGAQLANVVAGIALLGGLAWLVTVTVRRRLDPFAAGAAAVAIFLLCNKVFSPTYDVWLVAFFVMVPLGRRLWIAFCAVDLAVFATVYGYFGGLDSAGFVRVVLPVLVLIRTVVLLTVIARAIERPSSTATAAAALTESSTP
jgi:uncharacterized membrane protein